MAGRGNSAFIRHIGDHGLLYLIVILFFFLGVFGGTYTVKGMTEAQSMELLNYLDLFLKGLGEWNVSPGAAAQHATLNNLKIMLYVWLLGLTVIGIPLVLLLVSARGFVLGFTVGFLVQEKGGQGILIALVAILPPSILNIPTLIVGAVLAITFSWWLVKGRGRYETTSLPKQFAAYCSIMVLVAIISALAGFVEAYVSPTLLKLISQVTHSAIL